MNTTCRAAALALIAAFATSARAAEPANTPAQAQAPDQAAPAAPAYVGMWSKRMEHCSTKQKNPGAPMVVTEKGFDQYHLHCTFTKLEPVAAATDGSQTWKMESNCSWNGVDRPMVATLTVAGDTLTLTDAGGANILKRCAPEDRRP